MSELPATPSTRGDLTRLGGIVGSGTLAVYTLTIFLSAFLLFAVQPMFAKMVTPILGGTPAVWSVAMVFFQAVLLAGYTYAHALNRAFDLRIAALVHLVLIAVTAAFALPIGFDPAWGRPPDEGASFWLITVFAFSVGLPFFAVSANGPLLQSWFSRSGHVHAADPYFLYGASNLGSFLALIAYPFVIEPGLTLQAQSSTWSLGFIALGLSIALSALVVVITASSQALAAPRAATSDTTITGGDRLTWIGMAFVPSALLVAVTAHISTDLAAVPLLWVVPLALYLLTFVVAFGSAGERWHPRFLAAQPAALATLVMAGTLPQLVPLAVAVAAHLVFFFIAVLVCHGEVYRRRPAAAQLTQFYFFLSLGGVLGGIFASLVAPSIFNDVHEYPVMIVAAALCRPGLLVAVRRFGLVPSVAAVVALVAGFWGLYSGAIGNVPAVAAFAVICAVSVGLVLTRRQPLAFAALACIAIAAQVLMYRTPDIISRTRSFFAVHTVRESPDGRSRSLTHGTTNHGAELLRTSAGKPIDGRPEPATYFYRGGPYSQAIETVRAARGGLLGRVAVVGLGMGSLACHAREGEKWEFFEIDPEVVRIARDRTLFRSFTSCTPTAPVVLGDGRLTLADASAGYDLIILDAFSSDAVPVHLLTAEALAMYKSKLTPQGAIIFNISNRHMILDEVIAGSAEANGMVAFHRYDDSRTVRFEDLQARAHVAIAARTAEDVPAISWSGGWKRATLPAGERVWTDDYSNVLSPIRRKLGW
jgi:hypothetical protein